MWTKKRKSSQFTLRVRRHFARRFWNHVFTCKKNVNFISNVYYFIDWLVLEYYYTWRSVSESLLASVLRWPGVKYRVELNVSSKWWLWRWVKRICPPLRVVCNGCKIFGKWWWRLAAMAANRMAASWECGWDRKKGEATEADVIGVDKPIHTA